MICPDCRQEITIKRIWSRTLVEHFSTSTDGHVVGQMNYAADWWAWKLKHETCWCGCGKCQFVIEGDHIVHREEEHE